MRHALAAAGAVITACVVAWCVQGDQTGRVTTHLALYGTAFGAYLVALHASRDLSRRGLRIVVGVSILWRAALLTSPPLLSDDVYRYVWEGRIQLHGGNPFAWSDRPSAEKYRGLRDGVWERVNHKIYTAIYPPLWQLLARGVVWVHDSVAAMKTLVVLCEIGLLGVLARLLALMGLPRERLLVAAWSPLALVEIAGSGHNEALGLLLTALALLGLAARRPLVSAVFVALAFQAKLVPGLVAVAWARRFRPFHVAAAATVAGLLVIPYASAGRGLWRSLGKYGQFWRFDETLFAFLAEVAGGHETAVALALGLLAAIAGILALRRTEPAAAGLGILAAWLLLSPNVLPWYALWFLPFLVIRESPAVLLFTGTVSLAYLVYPGWLAGGDWQVPWSVRALQYGPCLLVAAETWRRSRRASS
jgi:hypothetical protein